jgi:hypothetical protein
MFAVIYSRVMRCMSSSSGRLRCSFGSSAFAPGCLDLYLTSGAVALVLRLEGRMQPRRQVRRDPFLCITATPATWFIDMIFVA